MPRDRFNTSRGKSSPVDISPTRSFPAFMGIMPEAGDRVFIKAQGTGKFASKYGKVLYRKGARVRVKSDAGFEASFTISQVKVVDKSQS
jgi:hypothetical protein